MCDLIGIRVKSRHPIKSCLNTRKKENMKIKDILHKSPSKRLGKHTGWPKKVSHQFKHTGWPKKVSYHQFFKKSY